MVFKEPVEVEFSVIANLSAVSQIDLRLVRISNLNWNTTPKSAGLFRLLNQT